MQGGAVLGKEPLDQGGFQVSRSHGDASGFPPHLE
jgi:hypothetical protein